MISEDKLKKKLEELKFEKGNLQIELDKVYNPQSSEYKEGSRMSDEKFTNIHNRITEIDAIISFCEGRALNEDWRDLPEKNEEQCEFCGKFFLNLGKHKQKVHGGKEQTKICS